MGFNTERPLQGLPLSVTSKIQQEEKGKEGNKMGRKRRRRVRPSVLGVVLHCIHDLP